MNFYDCHYIVFTYYPKIILEERRYQVLPDAEICNKQIKLRNENTLASKKIAERAFQEFISACIKAESIGLYL